MKIRTKLSLTLFSVILLLLILLTFMLKLEISHCFGMACESVSHLPQGLSQQLERRFNQALTQSLLWIIPLLVIVIVILLTILTRLFTKRILVMTDHARDIAEGEWNRSIPIKGHDELASLADTLNYLTTQLNKQEALRKQMIQDMAHELRTPLMTLKSHAEAFLDGVWEPDKQRLQSWLEEVERFEKLVASIETLYETDVQNAIAPRLLDVRKVVESLEKIFSTRCTHVGIELAVRYAQEPVEVRISREDASRLLWNLLDNAVKYTPQGGRIDIVVDNVEGSSVLCVTDTGVGIPEEELANVFERFYRIDKSRDRKKGGSGLGLAIVQQLVRSTGGEITVNSELDEGTSFCISWRKGGRKHSAE
ncbi:cell wall metabolism sensor histidine kinase WalK [Alicyclobacillus sp. SO9]|uniref:sensor histidine kinase n=1 Tax=Alicyclobacillus sp. SO9 TaxID=2665646 RepID=UPI0018E74D9E|nr:HAMP domain-containing sensor histidine kinase [Alicyclobacillus sp. SO9]QQE78452.1 HAMP domain-containing histidine kinase [Alicyclobacillus sp. SO9]